MADVRLRLREALASALKERDEVATAALRTAVSAIANAEAVVPAPSKVRLGVGAGDVPRRELSEAEMKAILQSEIEELTHAAADYRGRGENDRADRLHAEAHFLTKLLES